MSDAVIQPAVCHKGPTTTEPSVRDVGQADHGDMTIPFGVRSFTVGTSHWEPPVPDGIYSDKPLKRPNRTAPMEETIDYSEPSGMDLTIVTEDSGALSFWDSPDEGQCSEDHGDEA